MQRHEKVHCVVVLLAMAVAEGDLVMSEAGGKLYVEVCEGRCGPRRPLRSSLLQTIDKHLSAHRMRALQHLSHSQIIATQHRWNARSKNLQSFSQNIQQLTHGQQSTMAMAFSMHLAGFA
mmetsp:Transcript_7368/g.10106  ORF Transcript_7368/g.10106 Transcript_7368/m.10106 type:complete len:120 (-) Transcript_7368:303-662(-)